MFTKVQDWIVARADDITINLSTELVGVFFSVVLSIFIANYLDHRTDKRRVRTRVKRVYSVLVEQYEFLSYGIFSNDDFNISRLPPWKVRTSFWRYAKEFRLSLIHI